MMSKLLKSILSRLPLYRSIGCGCVFYCLYRPTKRTSPSADRNCPPIADALRCQLNRDNKNLTMFEIASGTGQHAAYFASLFTNIVFHPSDSDPANIPSIKAYADECSTNNMMEPLLIDTCTPPANWKTKFEPNSVDYMLNINMVHIAPFDAAVGLFRAAGYFLKPKGKLFTYGPYAENGQLTPHSNIMFDESLKVRNPEWGIRDIRDLKKLATANGLQLTNKLNMPANNKTLTWTKL